MRYHNLTTGNRACVENSKGICKTRLGLAIGLMAGVWALLALIIANF